MKKLFILFVVLTFTACAGISPGIKEASNWQPTKPDKRESASAGFDDIQDNFGHIDEIDQELHVTSSAANVFAAGADPVDGTNVKNRGKFWFGSILPTTPAPANGDIYFLANATLTEATPTFYFNGAWTTIGSGVPAGVSGIRAVSATLILNGNIIIFAGTAITVTSGTYSGINAITVTATDHDNSIHDPDMMETGERRDIAIGAVSLDNSYPPQISQTSVFASSGFESLSYPALNSIIFTDTSGGTTGANSPGERIHFDFVVPKNVTPTSLGLIVESFIGPVTETMNDTKGTQGGTTTWSLSYTGINYLPMSVTTTSFGRSISNYITTTFYTVTVTRFIPARVTNTVWMLPLTITTFWNSDGQRPDAYYCTVKRASESGTTDTIASSMRMMFNPRVYGNTKNPD